MRSAQQELVDMHSNSVHSMAGIWYGDLAHGAANTWRTDLACPPGLSKPAHPVQGRKGGVDGPPGFLSDRNRFQGQQFSSQAQGNGQRDYHDSQRPHDYHRPYGRSHSARRSRQQGNNYQQSPGQFANGNNGGGSFQHGRKTPNRRNLTPGPLRAASATNQDLLSPQSIQPLTPPPPASRPSAPIPRAAMPANSSISAAPSSPEPSCTSSTPGPKSIDVKPITTAAAQRLLEQVNKTPTQVVDNLTVTDQMAEKYHILQSEDGRTILFKKTPRGRRGGVKHRRKQAPAGEGIPEGSEAGSAGSPRGAGDKASEADSADYKPAELQQPASNAAAFALSGFCASISEPELNTPPQPPPRASNTRDWSPEDRGHAMSGAFHSNGSINSAKAGHSSTGSDAGVDDLMQELKELRAAKARAEEAQEQLTQQAQLLLQEKSQLVQQMAQKEKVIKNLEERLEFVQAECEDLRLATPNNIFSSFHEDLGVESDGLDNQTSAELHLLQALLSGTGQGGAQGMGAEGAAAVAAAIAQGQDGYYILDTRASKPADALQYFDEQQGSSLLGSTGARLTGNA